MRLNGWQRIGIVASVAWAIGAYVYTNSQQDWASQHANLCFAIERERDVRDDAEARVAECYRKFNRNLPIALAQQRSDAIALALVPVPLGWLLAYGVLWLVRWVRRGFVPKPSP
jgi:hypothetical protein